LGPAWVGERRKLLEIGGRRLSACHGGGGGSLPCDGWEEEEESLG